MSFTVTSFMDMVAELSESPLLVSLIHTNPDPALFLAENYNVVAANDLALALFNVSKSELLNTNFIEFFQRLGCHCPIEDNAKPTQASRVVRTTRLNGVVIDWIVVAVAGDEQSAGFLITAQVRDKTVDSLGFHSYGILLGYLDTILDNMPCAIFWKNAQLEYLGCNQHFADLVGLAEPDQVIGLREQDLNWIEQGHRYLTRFDKAVLTSKQPILNAAESYQLNNGNNIKLSVSRVPLFDDETNQVVGLLGVYVDVTQVENDQRRIEHLYVELQSIIDNVPCAVFWKDRESRFLGCNHRFAQFADLSPQDIIGKTDYELPWTKEESDSYRQDDQIVMTTRKPKLDIEEPQTTPEGKKIVLSTSKVPLIDKYNQVIGVLVVYTDITERKQAQQMATNLLVEQEKTRVYKLLSSSIAHELRTPLASIGLASNAIGKVFPILLDAYHKAIEANLELEHISHRRISAFDGVVDRVDSEIRTCNIFIDMTLAKLRCERMINDDLSLLSITHCVEEAIALYPFKQEQAELVHFAPDKEHDFVFYGEALSFRHVIFNLIKNALYFIQAAGKGDISIWLENDEDNNYLYFKDTGKGIEKQRNSSAPSY